VLVVLLVCHSQTDEELVGETHKPIKVQPEQPYKEREREIPKERKDRKGRVEEEGSVTQSVSKQSLHWQVVVHHHHVVITPHDVRGGSGH